MDNRIKTKSDVIEASHVVIGDGPQNPESAFGNVGGPVVRDWLLSAGYRWDDDSFKIVPLD